MEVFLFPLVNVTLFPKTTKPLNIFEPKYLAMVKESLRTGTPMALGYMEGVPSEPVVGQVLTGLRGVAGYGQPQVIEERSNGTMLIFLQGAGKIKIGPVLRMQEGFIVCEGEDIPENTNVSAEYQTQLDNLKKILTRWIRTHIPEKNQQDVFLKNMTGPAEIIGAFASYLIRDYDLQQMVLEINSFDDKIQFLYRLVESAEITA